MGNADQGPNIQGREETAVIKVDIGRQPRSQDTGSEK